MDNNYSGYIVSKSSFTDGKSIDLTKAEPFYTNNATGLPKSNGQGVFIKRSFLVNEMNAIYILTEDKKQAAEIQPGIGRMETIPVNSAPLESQIFISSDKPTKVYVLKGTDLLEATFARKIISGQTTSEPLE